MFEVEAGTNVRSKVNLTVTKPVFMKHTLDRELFKTNFCSENHEDSDETFTR
jgi:hypothetical protein